MRVLALCAVIWTATLLAQSPGGSLLLLEREGGSDAYRAVGRFRKGDYNCTGVFFKQSANPSQSAPAYVLTNGHCFQEQAEPNGIAVDRDADGFVFIPAYFIDTKSTHRIIPVRRIAYSTMKGTDLTVAELSVTYGELLSSGIQPLEIASAIPAAGVAVESIGAPVNSIPDDEGFLRIAACRITGRTNLLEFHWFFNDTIAHDCADIWGGSSGSPLLLRSTRQIIGLTNTTTSTSADQRGGNWDCFAGRPCEVTSTGTRVLERMNYVVPVQGVTNCFDSNDRFTLAQAGCALDPGQPVRLEGGPGRVTAPTTPDGAPVRWAVTVSGVRFFRFKTGLAFMTDCRSPEGYGPIQAAGLITNTLPTEMGRYNLCVLGGPTAEDGPGWQPARFASRIFTSVDREPPVSRPEILNFSEDAGEFSFRLQIQNPDLSGYLIKDGGEATTNCATRDGYVTYRRTPIFLPVSPPQKLCIIPYDEARIEGIPVEYRFGGVQIFPYGIRNAASDLPGPLGPGSVVSIQGVGFQGARVSLRDSAGVIHRLELFSATPHRLVALLPATVAPGAGSVEVVRPNGSTATAAVTVAPFPGLFRVDASGFRIAVANVVRATAAGTQSREATASCEPFFGTCKTNRIAPARPGERVFLELFGTGVRGARDLRVTLNGIPLRVTYAGEQGQFAGLDQINVELPDAYRTSAFAFVEYYTGDERIGAAVLQFRQD
jgi:uncharacterized protein (TIGR03437 family)